MSGSTETRQSGGCALGRRLRVAPILVVLFAGACVQVQPQPDYDRAHELMRQTTGRSEVYDPSVAPLTPEAIATTLAAGLSLDEALRISLLNNRELQAEFYEIGIAHAEWVQSGLLSNPSLDVLLRFPAGGGRSGLEGSLVTDLLELWRLPLREQAARHDLDATVLRIARRAAEQVAKTRLAYFHAAATEELVRVDDENVALARRSFQSVTDLREAGSADDLDQAVAAGPVLDARIALESARLEAGDARRDLARELSVQSDVGAVRLLDVLPDVAPAVPDAEAMVRAALAGRLDLRAMQKAVEAAEARLDLESRAAWGDVSGGFSAERPAGEGATIRGPALGLTLPIFDQNQAGVAKARFERDRLQRSYEAARVEVAQDVRSAIDRLRAAGTTLAILTSELFPQAERALSLAQTSYSEGRATLVVLIEAQRRVLDARRDRTRLREAAAIAAAELELTTGLRAHGQVPAQ